MGNNFKEIDQYKTNQDVSLLYNISSILSSTLDLNCIITDIFSVLSDKLGPLKGILLIQSYYDEHEYSKISFAFDPSQSEYSALIKVAKEALLSGKILFIPKLSNGDICFQPSEDEVAAESFICVPIILGKERFGSIIVDCLYKNDQYLKKNIDMFSILALMIGQKLQIVRLIDTEKEALRIENIKLKDELKEKYNIHNMIGKSNQMFQVYETIKQVAKSMATVLVRGESGTGKELVAHAIHYNSNRSTEPFIKINCGAIPEALLESELFGYEKGAFTDASSKKTGKLEAASGGTVFFDEIAELPLLLQVKLLRALQEKEITRLGGLVPISLDIRIIVATNRDLEEMIQLKQFREDLYYRLNVFPMFLPPLRERPADIILLAEHYLERFSKENKKIITSISRKVVAYLCSYGWPGNVRELMNCMERAVILCNGIQIDATHLPPSLQSLGYTAEKNKIEGSLKGQVAAYEEKLIKDTLLAVNGNQTEAARVLHTTPRIIGYKVNLYNITP